MILQIQETVDYLLITQNGSTLKDVSDLNLPTHGNTTKEYGTDSAGSYWRWTSDKSRGGDLYLTSIQLPVKSSTKIIL